MKLCLGAGKHPMPTSEGWVNVDKSNIPGIDRVVNLFSYPWDFPDNSVDEFNISHLVEHIPHEPRPSTPWGLVDEGWKADRWDELKDLDGFFCFFSEVWRIATPGAKVHIVTPFGYSRGAFQDPTHTRYIVPSTFAYLTAETRSSPDFDYGVPCLFETKRVDMEWLDKAESGMAPEMYDFAAAHFWDMARNMIVELEVIK